MKKNKIIVLALTLTMMFTFTACTTKNPKTGRNNTNLSTQTRDNRWDNNISGTDTVRNGTRDNISMDNNINDREGMDGIGGINNSLDNDFNMGINDGLDTNINDNNRLDTNINNGMTRPNNNSKMNKNATNLAKKITDLPEVDRASVLFTEKDAVIGVSLRGSTQGTMTNSLRKKIEDMVKKEEKSIDNISITTDPSLVNRINTMNTDIEGGNIIDNFTDEVRDLIRKITPNNMR